MNAHDIALGAVMFVTSAIQFYLHHRAAVRARVHTTTLHTILGWIDEAVAMADNEAARSKAAAEAAAKEGATW